MLSHLFDEKLSIFHVYVFTTYQKINVMTAQFIKREVLNQALGSVCILWIMLTLFAYFNV
jgi:hypothetical protein